MKPIDRVRRAVARLILAITIPTVLYVLMQMGNPEYLPAPGWVISVFALCLASGWACHHSEIFYTRTRD